MYDKLALLTDLYQLTMMRGYIMAGLGDSETVFDLFYRRNPSGGGYAIACGLAQVIEYLGRLRFSQEEIDFLAKTEKFDGDFLEGLKNFKFTGDIFAVPEGSLVFPGEPILRVKAPLAQAQFIETAVLNIINHQSLIATKASRVCYAARGDKVLEFGLRRAQGPDAGVYGARAAMIGGCSATSNVLCAKIFEVPVSGTHAHSWIMSFPDELSAFRAYAKIYPDSCTLLVDTYDTIKSGVPNAITVFSEMRENGSLSGYGVRLDSGDFAYLSKIAREMLDNAGFYDAAISASSDLDEYIIRDLKQQGAKITLWGVGTRLITSQDCPSFGGVYKLAAKENAAGVLEPTIKLSENIEKITNPGVKKLVRLYDGTTKKIKADLITLDDETVSEDKNLTIFHPLAIWKKMTLKAKTFFTREPLIQVFKRGELVYKSPSVMDIREYCAAEKDTLWDEYKRLINPHIMPVDLSYKLWELKNNMINEIRGA
ncbi:MAG: nicotinate phosphoribosyltransferase [Clostridiales bacterium]|jgi:nicotinate phosphoribosyltransferase|nr:nicotinate phosphoribosyltransferase [Clostridiales bacterium]